MVEWKWTAKEQGAFDTLKSKLMEAPILAHPDFSRPFVLQTDASREGLGAILAQRDKDGKEHVIQYLSRVLTKAEKNYGVTKLELLGVIWALEICRPYIHGAKFTVETDHRALQWITSNKKSEGQLARWALRIQEFLPFTIVHRKGTQNQNADALSRAPQHKVEYPSRTLHFEDLFLVTEEKQAEAESTSTDPVSDMGASEIQDLQAKDTYVKDIREFLEDPNGFQQRYIGKTRVVADQAKHYLLVNGLVYRQENGRNKLAVPTGMVNHMLELCHSTLLGAHLGVGKTLKRMQKYLHWPGMTKDVKRWIAGCYHCQYGRDLLRTT